MTGTAAKERRERGIEAAERAARRALPAWDLGDAELSLIKARENVVFRLDTQAERFVLRVHRPGYHTDAELRSEMLWSRALEEAGVRTPRAVSTRDGAPFVTVSPNEDGRPRQVDLVEWIDGTPLGEIEAAGDAGSRALVEAYRTLGEIAGRIHERGRRWTPPAGFVRPAWDVPGIVGEQPLWGRFWEHPLLEPEQREVVRLARERLARDLRAFGQGADRFGLIHADLLPENVLVTADGIRLIDFDDCGTGWDLFELATSLFLHVGAPHETELREALLAGYRSERPLPEDHLPWLPVFLAARATTYLGWIHTRPESETAEKLGPWIVSGVVELLASYGQGP